GGGTRAARSQAFSRLGSSRTPGSLVNNQLNHSAALGRNQKWTLQSVLRMMEVAATIARNIMERFLERHQGRIVGVLSGFDRILFRGTLRSICHLTGMDMFLSSQRVLYKDFGVYVNKLSEGLKERAEALAQRAGRPFRYLASSDVSKEEVARKILEENRI